MFHNISNTAIGNTCIYKKSIIIPDAVKIEIQHDRVVIIGVLGKLTHKLNKNVYVHLHDLKYLNIYLKHNNISEKPLLGTTRSLIDGMIKGVMVGFVKKLQLVGIGYRVSIENNNNILNLMVGLSHPVYYKLPDGIKAQCLNQTEIILKSIDKQLIGQIAADLRAIRPPDPFKGKGIRYTDEIIKIKETKKR